MTTLAALGAAVVMAALWRISPPLPGFLHDLLLLALELAFVASSLVAAGGLVCLWRDARVAAGRGDLIALSAPSAPAPGVLARMGLRFLQGTALRPGDCVRVRTLDEIRATLREDGTLDGLPFMPEMHGYCGGTFRVHRRIDKINDMRNKTGLRRMRGAVTLTAVRCSGAAHGGCQAECQILWKERWLERIRGPAASSAPEKREVHVSAETRPQLTECADRVYICQMTRLWEASHPMSPFDPRQLLRPLLCGNVGFVDWILVLLTRLFTRVQALRGGAGFPYMPPSARTGASPSSNLQLQPRERVAVLSRDEVARTLVNSRNRGLWFDPDLVRFCGQPAVVRRRVDRVIHESTGTMVTMKTPCVVLEDVIATGEYLRLCSQHEYIFWREAWLARADRDVRPPSAG